MEQSAKFFPKTLKALRDLNDSANELKLAGEMSVEQTKELSSMVLGLNEQIKEKIKKVETIINTLSKVVDEEEK